ncbi:DNA cytosine methyltransferase [Ignavigranum ruoffiae]|uniref:Cytosine-specific methyltransferase n=1 Tax=Ignavigranum ruoffiae TaxID=89093 RepID=A0A1H9FDZ4_9LACT|nr:DNA (cytosine-5-)-methyltransferase [Ignavigranum ruoffiae]SEQ35538.1 DNA (cytosine-5)-methyltransferase 1 [Ignavigranum ruoffiae]
MNYIDLFAGAGGFTLGLERLGFNNLFSVEYDEQAALTYKQNFPSHNLIQKDIRDLTDEEIKSLISNNNVDIVIGGPPCQGFSIAGNIGRKFIDDDRNKLFKEFVRVVKVTQPELFIMENVAHLATHNKGRTINEITSEFEKLGYKTQYKVLNSVNFEVPQNRRRIFVVGTKNVTFEFPKESTKNIPIEEVISDLPSLQSGETSAIPNHNAMNHTKQMLLKMSYVEEGGDRMTIPEEIRPKSGDVRKYIRYSRNKPSITITGDMRKVFHYEQNRALTPRELARIQTFPDSFIFYGNSISIQQQIGNAVPPKLAIAIARSIINSIKGTD